MKNRQNKSLSMNSYIEEQYRILTNPQTPLERIKSLEAVSLIIRQRIWDIQHDCQHKFRPLTQEETDDHWFSESASCILCGKHDFGWRCKESMNGYCEYCYESHGENCIWCGLPQERK